MSAMTTTTTSASPTIPTIPPAAPVEAAVVRPRPRPSRPSLRKRLAFIGVSIVISLLLAEQGAALVHHRAFPYLNIFQADPVLGVRLQPNASTRIRSRSGRTTDIRTNALGYRGADWNSADASASANASGKTRVALLGDSQMFGYNVDEDAALASQLESAAEGDQRYQVLNAAVPTWGPPDYVIALREIAHQYHPRFVLFVANAANDWFEPVPNRRRTTAIDGWVTRAGSPNAPSEKPQWFPFREWMMSRSHLVFGIRQVTSYVGSEGQMASSQSAVRLKTDLRQLRKGVSTYRSTITPSLKAAMGTCAELGCEVIAVALPCDVQVSAAEWSKYRGSSPIDLSDTEALLDDFVADARDLGIRAVNLLAPLRAAEPGAFLDDDYHLSPRGHRVVADTLLPILNSEETTLLGVSKTP